MSGKCLHISQLEKYKDVLQAYNGGEYGDRRYESDDGDDYHRDRYRGGVLIIPAKNCKIPSIAFREGQ